MVNLVAPTRCKDIYTCSNVGSMFMLGYSRFYSCYQELVNCQRFGG